MAVPGAGTGTGVGARAGALQPNRLALQVDDQIALDHAEPQPRRIAAADPRVKVIVNARNFGLFCSMFNGLMQTRGDAVVALFPADLQDPPELIPQFIAKWREGYEVVHGIIGLDGGSTSSKAVLIDYDSGKILCKAYQLSKGNPIQDAKELLAQIQTYVTDQGATLDVKGVLRGIPGAPPSLLNPPSGCVFHPRCPQVMPRCSVEVPAPLEARPNRSVACHLYD